MTRKIFRSIFAVLLSCLALTTGELYTYFRGVQKNQLQTELGLTVAAVEMNGEAYLEKMDTQDCRITWINADGTVLYDSQRDVVAMENHSGQEEIRKALKTCGTGMNLSIVKHAVQYTKGKIRLKSAQGEGTAIKVVFPQ